MKKAVKCAVAIIFAVGLCAGLCACESERQFLYTDLEHFGSAFKAVIYCSEETFGVFEEKTDDILDELSAAFDENIPTSFISRFNNAKSGERTEIDGVCLEAFRIAEKAFALTDGFYDPTAANLVDLWGFSPRFYGVSKRTEEYDRVSDENGAFPLPDNEYIEAFSSLVGLKEVAEVIENDGKTYIVKKKTAQAKGKTYEVKLDFGGIVKGLAVEKVTALCRELEIEKGYISYGTSSLYLMKNASMSDWDLALTNPRGENGEKTYFKTKLSSLSAATSGDYERYYFVGGRRYSHIIDVKTGEPVNNGVCAVTVIGAGAGIGDCLATGLLASGKETIIEFAYSDYAKENGIKIVAAFEEGDGMKVFTTVEEYETLSGEEYER